MLVVFFITLTGWGMIYLQLKGSDGRDCPRDGNIHYHKPVTSQPKGVCHYEYMTADFDALKQGRKCRVDMKIEIRDGDRAWRS